MASPIYGTDLAGMSQLLAGRARGMAEAERIKRMQQQQDFSNAYQMLNMQNRMEQQDLNRRDRYDWNAYNAAMGQRRQQIDYDFDVYDRINRQDQQAWQRGMAEDRLGLAKQRMSLAVAQAMARGMPRQKPMGVPEIKDVYQAADLMKQYVNTPMGPDNNLPQDEKIALDRQLAIVNTRRAQRGLPPVGYEALAMQAAGTNNPQSAWAKMLPMEGSDQKRSWYDIFGKIGDAYSRGRELRNIISNTGPEPAPGQYIGQRYNELINNIIATFNPWSDRTITSADNRIARWRAKHGKEYDRLRVLKERSLLNPQQKMRLDMLRTDLERISFGNL